jgi:hypothetical protein
LNIKNKIARYIDENINMECKINLYIDNITGVVKKINWKNISGEVEFKFMWAYNNKPIAAKNIIFNEKFSKCVSIKKSDMTIKKIKFINDINLDIIINFDFLMCLKNLEEIDLAGLSNLKQINGSFLHCCCSLNKINLDCIKNIESIGPNFLGACKNLKEIDLSALLHITKIPAFFLGSCDGLKEIDLSPLKNATLIEDGFMVLCTNLEVVKNMSFYNVKIIERGFMDFCISLKTINLNSLIMLEYFDISFLGQSTLLNFSPPQTIDDLRILIENNADNNIEKPIINELEIKL